MAKNDPPIADLWLRPDMNLKEACRATGRSWETLRQWMADGQVRYYNERRCVRILTDSIRERSTRLADDQSGGGRW